MKSTLSIFSALSRSPIQVLQKHMNHVAICASILLDFFDTVQQGDWERSAEYFKAISHAEKQADLVKRDLRMHLPKKLRLVVSRSDILNLLITQDTVANKVEDIAGLVYGRKMRIPDALFPNYQKLLHNAVTAIQQAYYSICEFNDVIKTGFGDISIDQVRATINKLDDLEHESDSIEVNIRKKLLAIEDTLPPVTVMFLYQVIQSTGELADHAQQIGKRLLLLVA